MAERPRLCRHFASSAEWSTERPDTQRPRISAENPSAFARLFSLASREAFDLTNFTSVLYAEPDVNGEPDEGEFCPSVLVARASHDKRTTKIAAGVILHDGAEAVIECWVATDVTTNPRVQREMEAFFNKRGVKSVAMKRRQYGLPA